MGIEGEHEGASGASLAAALSQTEKGWSGGVGDRNGSFHRRTASLPSASAMQAALEISTSLAAAHAQSLQQSLMGELDAQDAALPVMLHVQMTVEAAIQGVVPGHGHFSIDVRGANVAVTSYPVPPGASGRNVRASKPRLVKSVCVCFDHVEMQLVKHLLHSGPIVVASNVRANLLSSLVPASANARHGRFAGGGGARTGAGEDTGNDLKEEVLIMARKHESVTLCMDTLQLKSLQLHQQIKMKLLY